MHMDNDNNRTSTYSRRAFIIGAAQGTLLTILGGRLAWLQVAQGERYKILAENNRINVKMLAPSRGEIVDRFGVPLAVNNQNFRVLIVPEQTSDLKDALRRLGKIIKIDPEEVEKILKQAKKSASFMPLEIADDLEWEEVAKIEVNLPDLPGISTDAGEIRDYPFNEATAHIVGYVGSVNKEEAEKEEDPLLTLPGFRIGKTGIEKTLDTEMRGKSGSDELEVNVSGRVIRNLKHNPPAPGNRVELTIDAELQRYTQQRLSERKSASAIIMDVHTGAVYALASHPSFDPNMFTRGISSGRWEELISDPTFPLTNKAVAGQYPPGSTFKMVTSLAGLKYKAVHRNTTVRCNGHYIFGKNKEKFHCWKKYGHGTVNMISALAESCDTFFYKISTDIGIERMAKTARQLGLGQEYNFELGEEKPGLIPDKNWKIKNFKTPWMPGETVVASIGQGYIQATPLQLAVMTSRLVNGGYAVEPWIVGGLGNSKFALPKWKNIGFDKTQLDYIKLGMDRVVNHEKGTAHSSMIEEKDMRMGGKTGTSQVKRITLKDREKNVKNEDLPWKYRHHALFVGYAPLHNPRYACCVVVEHGVGGSTAAAPIAKDLLYMTQKRNPAKNMSGTD
jgi:penicillin-binding protein 2